MLTPYFGHCEGFVCYSMLWICFYDTLHSESVLFTRLGFGCEIDGIVAVEWLEMGLGEIDEVLDGKVPVDVSR